MEPFLSIVIPAYDEAERLPPTLTAVAGYLEASSKPAEIVVVDDGSSDRTVAAARNAASQLGRPNLEFQVLENGRNRGKGSSVRRGMLAARGRWALFTDADLSTPIEEADKLLDAAERGSHDVVIGSRALDRSLIGTHQPLFREISGRVFNLVARVTAGLPFHDTQCGFKLFSQRAARGVFSLQRLDRFGFDVEALFLARKLGFSIAETPVHWNDAAGSKVTALKGADAFLDILRVRWNDLRGRYR